MPATDAQRVEVAGSVRGRFARDQSLTVVQARAFVRSIQTTWQVETIQWSQADSFEILSQARRLIHAARILTTVEGGSDAEAVLAFRRAGELFEWLARSNDEQRTSVPLGLYAAGAYQLGGLPAMATGLLRQVAHSDAGSKLFADFLKGDFESVLQRASRFWAGHPELMARDAGATYFSKDEEQDSDDMAWLATVELVRCVGLASNSLRRGEHTRFGACLSHIQDIESFLLRTAPDDIALLAYFLRAACERFGKATIYNPLGQLADLYPARRDYVTTFARVQYAKGRGILWQSQQQGIERLLHNSSFALCTPTGSGKTLVANLAIVKELLLLSEHDGLAPLALYLVPSRALAGEVEAKLTSELGRDFIVTGLYGGSDWGITDAWLTADTPTVLIATVEKADALMRYLGPVLLARMRLLIVDEAHQVVIANSVRDQESLAEHTNRAVRLESFISRLLSRRPDIVRIALTAVAGGAAHPVARWIESNDEAAAVGTYYRSTRQAVGVLEIRPRSSPRIGLDILNDRPLSVVGRSNNIYVNLRIPAMLEPPAAQRNSLNHHTQIAILWAAIHLADGDRRILVSVTQSPEDTMRWYSEAFVLPGWEALPAFVPPAEGDDAELFAEARAVCVDYCGPNSHEVQLLDRGIATNHGQMPQRLRRMMVALIERSICRITVATATLTEGVNLPFDIIFLPSLKRTVYDAANQRSVDYPLSIAEFRNLSGRAGRPGAAKGMEGMTLVALPMAPSATAPKTRATQFKQARARRNEYADLLRKLGEEAAGGGERYSPLAVLLRSIRTRALNLPGVDTDAGFLNWLDDAAPGELSDRAGTSDPSSRARLADSLDELDGIVLSAIEELRAVDGVDMTSARAEATLAAVWQKTFARVAAAYEAWMEEAFIKRGRAIVETVYPDADERRRLYSYGYSPHIGRRFEHVADQLLEILSSATEYGVLAAQDRIDLFIGLGNIVAADGGYGFSVKDTVIAQDLYARWPDVLGWWMKQADSLIPPINDLRAWQSFVAENLEFRLGVAIGATVARVWSDATDDPFDTPTLENWKETTKLPWFAFWAKELLRWGTLEPFVAFALSQGMIRARSDADALRSEFIKWLEAEKENVVAEDLIDPQNFLKWSRSRLPAVVGAPPERTVSAKLTGTDGARGRYAVLPIQSDDGSLRWIDAAGYELAISDEPGDFLSGVSFRNDFDLTTAGGQIQVRRIF